MVGDAIGRRLTVRLVRYGEVAFTDVTPVELRD
jgi:hypothetical protein